MHTHDSLRTLHLSFSQGLSALAVLALTGTMAGCGASPSAATITEPPRSQAPVITRADVIPNSKNILSATIAVETDTPTQVTVMVYGQGREPWNVPISSSPATEHLVPVLGLYAATSYEFMVTATTPEGAQSPVTILAMTTSALPDDIPDIQVSVTDPEQVSPGITMFGIGRMEFKGDMELPGFDRNWYLIVGVDQHGEIVWFRQSHDGGVPAVEQRSNGNLLVMQDETVIWEMDLMGEVLWRLTKQDLGLDSIHHETIEVPSGNLLSFSSEMRRINGYTDKDGNPATYNVVGDLIIEFTPSGEVVRKVNLFDILDTQRIMLPDFHFPFWDNHYPGNGSKDWTHANGITYDPRDDSYIVSLRHQDWIIKIDRASGELVWKLGRDGDFTLTGDGGLPYHQHRPELQPNGNIMVYDNGNGRPPTEKDALPYTRVVEFAVDEAKREVKQVWEYRGKAPYFAPAAGDVRRLPNGNVLITDSAVVEDRTKPMFSAANPMLLRISEVTYEPQPKQVFAVTVRNASTNPRLIYISGSAVRIDSLYPASQ